MRGSRGKIVMKTNPKPGSPPFPHSNRIFTLINFEFTNNKNRVQFPLENKTFPQNHTPYKNYLDPCMLNTCMVL